MPFFIQLNSKDTLVFFLFYFYSNVSMFYFHSTIRGVHTLFTPIEIQHAATEGHLGRRAIERRRGSRKTMC